MTKQPEASRPERRSRVRNASPGEHWHSAITRIEPNKILIRGYPVDELMGRLSFGEAIYLILRGELPTPAIGRLFSAVLTSSIDHGVTPPSTLAARNAATTRAPLRACVAAGMLAFGQYHGGDIEPCMQFLQEGLSLVRQGAADNEAAAEILRPYFAAGNRPPGFGHRIHTHDPRAARLFQMAHQLELDGEYVHMMLAVERAIAGRPEFGDRPMPINVDGAIAAVCADLGFEPEIGNALFIIARLPGLIAHVYEERVREKPLRQIDPKEQVYDGPPERRLPETRK